jgi:hypothetical protein
MTMNDKQLVQALRKLDLACKRRMCRMKETDVLYLQSLLLDNVEAGNDDYRHLILAMQKYFQCNAFEAGVFAAHWLSLLSGGSVDYAAKETRDLLVLASEMKAEQNIAK